MRHLSQAAIPLLFLAPYLAGCGEDRTVAGTYTSTGNAQAAGRVVSPEGEPVAGAQVECRPDSLASWVDLEPQWRVRTDAEGRWTCRELPVGSLGVSVRDPASGLSAWHALRAEVSGGQPVPPDTLGLPGVLRVSVSGGVEGTLHLSGLGRFTRIAAAGEYEFADIPGKWSGVVRLTRPDGTTWVVDSARVHPGGLDSVGFGSGAALVSLPLAGGTSETVRQLPLLVRLDSTWSGFAGTREDGADLRLSTLGGSDLPVAVASWDKIRKRGVLWTVLDSLPSPADSVRLVLRWGATRASSRGTGFTNANGWLAAWPLGDPDSSVLDRTGLHPGFATGVTPVDGIAGKASRFDGSVSRIEIRGSETGPLDLVPGGPYAITCWARLTSWKTSRYLVGRGDQGHGLKFQKSVDRFDNVWLGRDMRAEAGAGSRYAVAPADSGRWVHLAMVVRDSQVSLWVDGSLRSGTTISVDNGLSRRSAPWILGATLDSTGAFNDHFSGDLAEVWIHDRVRSSDWIRLVAANQAPGAPGPRVR